MIFQTLTMSYLQRRNDFMQDFMMYFSAGLRLLPFMGIIGLFLIVFQYFNLRRLKDQFLSCTARKAIVQEMGIREPTRMHPYRHCFVICSFSDSANSVEVPYESGDLKHVKVGDEIPLYFLPNGVTTVVAYDESTTKKKFRQQVLMILIICAVMPFLIIIVGQRMAMRTRY